MHTHLDALLEDCGSEVKNHSQRTGKLIRALLTEVGRGDLVDFWHIEGSGPCDYHDIGKYKKEQSPLDHCQNGAALFEKEYDQALDAKARVFYSIARDLCLYHHEHWDGTGGPERLYGNNIPIIARAGAVADAWDHLSTQRPALPQAEKLEIIKKNAGTWYDPGLMAALERLFPAQPVE